MATPMTYDVILREKGDPKKMLKFPHDGGTAVCWYMLMERFDEFDGADDFNLPVLDSLSYSFYEDNMDVHAVTRLFKQFFGKCPYEVQYEITELPAPVNGCTHNVFITGFDKMPRGLFMSKMFMIRNLIRDEKSTEMFTALLDGGVPYGIAAFMGGSMESYEAFGGKKVACMKDYAGYISVRTPFFAEMVRSMAANVYCEQTSPAWEQGCGYNTGPLDDDYNPPREIEGCIKGYKTGDHLPKDWVHGSLYEMDEESLNTLFKFICEPLNLQINITLPQGD